MAIIATLNATEHDFAGNRQSIASIPLNKLVPWDGNVRKTGASDGLEELTASIAANGVLQSLVVRKTSRGKFAVVAGRRRFLALSALAEGGTIADDSPVPCKVIPGSADATEISLAENVVRAPMHPADQFEAFRNLVEDGSTPADIAARFGISETAVKKRLKLARVSPAVFEAYRRGELDLEQVQAFAVSDDHAAQERVFAELSNWNNDATQIRDSLTQDQIQATDKRVRFVSLTAYEEAGGAVTRDLFAEGDDGVFVLDPALLDRLALKKLESEAHVIRAEGWNWVEVTPEFDYEARSQFERLRPETLPLSEESATEQKRLTEEYHTLFEGMEEGDEDTSARLDAIEARITELEDTGSAFTPETIAIAGAVVTIGHHGEIEVVRGLEREEDAPPRVSHGDEAVRDGKRVLSAALAQSLTEHRSMAISATLIEQPDMALAAIVHALVLGIFSYRPWESVIQLWIKVPHLNEDGRGTELLNESREQWKERLPRNPESLWDWCLGQDRETLLELLAFCAALSADAVQRKSDRPDAARLVHAGKLAAAVRLDMAQWFTPTAENFFSRVSRDEILSAIAEAKGIPPRRSWNNLKKSELAALAERETAGTGWLPQLLKA